MAVGGPSATCDGAMVKNGVVRLPDLQCLGFAGKADPHKEMRLPWP